MATSTSHQLFLNLPVRNLEQSMAFFRKLGLDFNPQFTDDNAACMVLSDKGFVMLLQEPYFRTFTKKEICDTSKYSEALIAMSVDSRAGVDEFVDTAISGGGSPANDPQDHGFMYMRTFYDLDGHHWEIMWMDPSAVQG